MKEGETKSEMEGSAEEEYDGGWVGENVWPGEETAEEKISGDLFCRKGKRSGRLALLSLT